jgi:hypothetical protein
MPRAAAYPQRPSREHTFRTEAPQPPVIPMLISLAPLRIDVESKRSSTERNNINVANSPQRAMTTVVLAADDSARAINAPLRSLPVFPQHEESFETDQLNKKADISAGLGVRLGNVKSRSVFRHNRATFLAARAAARSLRSKLADRPSSRPARSSPNST